MKQIQLDVTRTTKQREAWEALADYIIRRLLYGGAKGGGKSYFLCAWLFTMVWDIMVQAKLKLSKNPPHVAWFGRKQATDFTGSTLQTWREVIPEEYYELKGATERDPKHILIAGRIAIDYGGLDKQENINKFNSAEYIIIAVDQAEEVTKDDISTVRGSLRMILKLNGKPVVPHDSKGNIVIDPVTGEPFDHWPYKELYTANPRQCWLKDDFILSCPDNARFVPALPTDNPHLPGDYLQTLNDAFGHRPELLRAYKEGDWSGMEGAEQIIKNEWLQEAKYRVSYAPQVKRYLVCDTARFGDDECVIHLREDMEILEKVIMPQCRSTQISSKLAVMSKQNNDCAIVVEALGADLGAAVVDELLELGCKAVISFNPAAASEYKNEQDKPIYGNLRAEAWSKTAKVLSSGILDEEANTFVCCKNMYQSLQNELCIPTYKFKNTRIMVEKKDEIKKRLGKSPDHADCYVIGTWAWDLVDFVVDKDDGIGYRRKGRHEESRSPMKMC